VGPPLFLLKLLPLDEDSLQKLLLLLMRQVVVDHARGKQDAEEDASGGSTRRSAARRVVALLVKLAVLRLVSRADNYRHLAPAWRPES